MSISAIQGAIYIYGLLLSFMLTGTILRTDDEELSNVWENEYLADDPTVPTSIPMPTTICRVESNVFAVCAIICRRGHHVATPSGKRGSYIPHIVLSDPKVAGSRGYQVLSTYTSILIDDGQRANI